MVFTFETQVVLVIGICLVSTFFLNLLARRMKLPQMIAPLIIGLILNYFLQYFIVLPEMYDIVQIFANFGIIIVLFFIGLGVDFRFMKNLSKNSSIMALNAAHIPFFLGFAATFVYTRSWVQAIFVGIALTITAEEVTVAILEELNLLNKRVGQLIIEAGIIGDIFEITAIAMLGIFMKKQSLGATFTVLSLLIELLVFISAILIVRYYVIPWLLRLIGRQGRKVEYFSVALVTLLITTASAELLNFSYIIGALVAGIILKDKLIEDKLYYEEHHIIEALEVFNFGVFHPLIFIWIGLSLDYSLIWNNITFGILLTVLALAGKVLGSIIGNYFCREPLSEGILVGWGLNARGATELFALLIAQSKGIVSPDIFSAVVFMALLTTIISPTVFKMLVLRGYGLVDHRKKH